MASARLRRLTILFTDLVRRRRNREPAAGAAGFRGTILRSGSTEDQTMKGHDFQGVNAAYVAELYDRYRQDPDSVDAATRAEFDAGLIPDAAVTATPGEHRRQRRRRRGRRHRQPRRVHPPLRPPGGDPRSAGLRAARRSVARRPPRRHGRDAGAPAGQPGRRPGRGRLGQRARGDHRAAARSTARPSATTTRTSSCPRSASGCATPSRPAASGRRCRRSTTSSCSIA